MRCEIKLATEKPFLWWSYDKEHVSRSHRVVGIEWIQAAIPNPARSNGVVVFLGPLKFAVAW